MILNEEKYLKDLESIVNIDSQSSDKLGVNRVADFFSERFDKAGFEVKRVSFEKVGDLIIASNNLEASSFDVLVCGHMDTVFPSGEAQARPFSIKDGNAMGPGAIDDKAGCISLLHMAEAIKIPSNKNILLILNSEEETGSIYTADILTEYAKKSKNALIVEAARPNGELVAKRRGSATYKIEFFGKSAHSGNSPEKGKNAVVEMARWVQEIHSLNDFESGGDISTNSVITETGSKVVNTISDYTAIMTQIRSFSKLDLDGFLIKLENLKKNPIISGIEIKITEISIGVPMYDVSGSLELRELAENVGKEIGIDLQWVSSGGGSDAGFMSLGGCPVIDGLGPIGGKFHTDEEYVAIDSIESRYNLLYKIVEKILTK